MGQAAMTKHNLVWEKDASPYNNNFIARMARGRRYIVWQPSGSPYWAAGLEGRKGKYGRNRENLSGFIKTLEEAKAKCERHYASSIANNETDQKMQSLRRVRKRQGRCFELAFKIMFEEPGAERFTLIHGGVCFQHPASENMVAHAWVELGDGRIFDPVLNEYMSRSAYTAKMHAVIERQYNRLQAIKLMAETRHTGPWHTTELLIGS